MCFFSMRAWIPLSFRGQYWFGMYVKCNTSLTHNGSMYETDCSPENDNEYVIKIPAEATQMCVQVSRLKYSDIYVPVDWKDYTRSKKMSLFWKQKFFKQFFAPGMIFSVYI